ncbi:MAG: hypothetical protein JW888_05555 [Pirellulales bacterium]|nr:hypothetical protein [Pirellulales bacterium]
MRIPSIGFCLGLLVCVGSLSSGRTNAQTGSPSGAVLENKTFRLEAVPTPTGVTIRLHDRATRFDLANGPYRYRLSRRTNREIITPVRLENVSIKVDGQRLIVRGTLGALDLEQVFTLPKDKPWMQERISLRNATDEVVELADLRFGFARAVSDNLGNLSGGLRNDRFVAVPFRHRPSEPGHLDADYSLEDMKRQRGRERVCSEGYGRFRVWPADQWSSEGWAWQRPGRSFGFFKFNQEAIEFSPLALERGENRLDLCFGGASMVDREPSCLERIGPRARIDLGATRYVSVPGNYTNAYYAFRRFLDEQGCRFPADFNPPVQWNEIYDNPEWFISGPPGSESKRHLTRRILYTREAMEEEAKKARAYGCEALYLDPGWDTVFGSFVWGKDWLGPQPDFVQMLQEKYGLKLALHCPLGTWVSRMRYSWPTAPTAWPKETYRKDRNGKLMDKTICTGSEQYLDEAARRLKKLCADGAVFLMFDGNDFNGGCWNQDHGHPIPYTREAHCRANLELARRVHAEYPDVLIEMHDSMTAGSRPRYLPVYYKYGLPGSFDSNWGFEYMLYPLRDLRRGYARSLYYYNLGCNVPIYLHVDLQDDNDCCLMLWWYASTCRHLGIGGTHNNPLVARAQQAAMKKYRELDRFYKRGDFYGAGEEVHAHVLPDENAFVINLFNLSDQPRAIGGVLDLKQMGLDPSRWYTTPKGGRFDRRGNVLRISRHLDPWATEVLEVKSYVVE